MSQDQQNSQTKRNDTKEKTNRETTMTRTQKDEPFIIGQGDPNLSPDAGKPLI